MDGTLSSDQHVIKLLGRNTLEDDYLRLKDEHLHLKKHARDQEEKVKRLATKMTRIINEKKKEDKVFGTGRMKDFEMEDAMEDLQSKMRNLERENTQLKGKLLVTKQMVANNIKKQNPYSHIQPKVNTGLPRASQPWPSSSPRQRRTVSAPVSPYAVQLLEEARNEIKRLEEIASTQHTQLEMFEQEIDMLKEQLKVKDSEHEEEMMLLKAQVTHGQMQHIQENVDLIKMKRDAQKKSEKIATFQAEVTGLKEMVEKLKLANDHLVKEVDLLTTHLKEEQRRNLELEEKLKVSKIDETTVKELEERLFDKEKENEILKEANEKLITSIVSDEREEHFKRTENMMKAHISQLEVALKADINEKEDMLMQLTSEKEKLMSLEDEYQRLQELHQNAEDRCRRLEESTSFSKVDNFIDQISERKNEKQAIPSFLMETSTNTSTPTNERFQEVDHDKGELIAELERINGLLSTQHKISHEAQLELNSSKEKFQKMEEEYKVQIHELSYLLDARSKRVQELELQLKSIMMGSQQIQITEVYGAEEDEEDLNLQDGKNYFEIHIDKVVFTPEGKKELSDKDPSVFISWSFYDFQPQSTPLAKGFRPEFNCTARYSVDVDDSFVHYLKKEALKLELQEARGLDLHPVGGSVISLRNSMKHPHRQHHGKQPIFGVTESKSRILIGTIEYWVRFLPAPENAAQFLKVASRPSSSARSSSADSAKRKLSSSSTTFIEGSNYLHVEIIKCTDLVTETGVAPSAYCIYKFNGIPDQDTPSISSCNPEFSDHRTFRLKMDNQLHDYLTNGHLEVFVFDDNDTEVAAYIGRAMIPLKALSENADVKGMFPLENALGDPAGIVEVLLFWQNVYKAPHPSPELKPPVPKPRTSSLAKTSSVPRTSTPRETPEIKNSQEPEIEDTADSQPEKRTPSPVNSLTSESFSFPTKSEGEVATRAPGDVMYSSLPTFSKTVEVEKDEGLSSEEEEASDEKDVVMKPVKGGAFSKQKSDSAVITISYLSFLPDAPVLRNPAAEMIFVEFRFLDCLPEELETPYSLPKPKPPKKVVFNFQKVIRLDKENHLSRRKMLKQMITSKSENNAVITFTAVSEPPESNTELECEDIGYVTVDLKKILESRRNVIQKDLPLLDFKTDAKIGVLNVSVEILDVLEAVRNEEML